MWMAYRTDGQTMLKLELWLGNIRKAMISESPFTVEKDSVSNGNRTRDCCVNKPLLNPVVLRALWYT